MDGIAADRHDTGQVAESAAEIYDAFFVPPLFSAWPAHLLRAAGVAPGDRLLDVGCGTGVAVRQAAGVVGPRGSVTGIDVNEGMLAVARARARGPDVEWHRGAAEHLPFHDDRFDVAVSQFALMFFADRRAALAEMQRVVQPGGRVALAVWGRLEETPGYAAVRDLLDELFGAEAAASIEVPYCLGERAALDAELAAAGVSDPRVETLTEQARFPSIDAWMHTDVRGWTLADQIDDEGLARLLDAARSRLARFAGDDGAVAFAAPAHVVSWEVGT